MTTTLRSGISAPLSLHVTFHIRYTKWKRLMAKFEANRIELVILGSHTVSGTQCPVPSDQVKWWSESRAVALKGQCPVGNRGEYS